MVDKEEGGLVDAWINRPRRQRVKAPRPLSELVSVANLVPAPFQARPAPTPTPLTPNQPATLHPAAQQHTPQSASNVVAPQHPVRTFTNRRANNPPFWCLIVIVVILVTATFSFWKTLHTVPHGLLADYTSIDYAIGNVSAASTTFTQHCCPIPQNCSQVVRSSLQKAIVSGRDAKSTVDQAINALGDMMVPIRSLRGMSCARARFHSSKIEQTARLSVSAADHYADAVRITEGVQGLLDTAVSDSLRARKELYTHRKDQLGTVWRSVQEAVGLADDPYTDQALEQYNIRNTTINILRDVRRHTVLAVALFDAQEAIWRSVAADLQALGARLYSKADVANSETATCVDSDAHQGLVHDLETMIGKVVARDG